MTSRRADDDASWGRHTGQLRDEPLPSTPDRDLVERLREALRPFAETGAMLDPKPKDDACWAGQTPAPPITFGHLRRATEAYVDTGAYLVLAQVYAALPPPHQKTMAEDQPRWRCRRCGRDEVDARANGCEHGPCPMDFFTIQEGREGPPFLSPAQKEADQ